MRRAVRLGFRTVAALPAVLALGYVLSGTQWPLGSHVAFFVNANTADTVSETDAVRSAMSTWSGVNPAGLRLSYGGSSAATGPGHNGTNSVCWQDQGANSTLATSYWWYTGNRIIESDIVFNDYHDWSTSGGGGVDIETVALHELGHSIGLLHSPTGIMQAYYGGVRRTLDSDALAGFAAMYGVPVSDVPPSVSITAPVPGAILSGLVPVNVTAVDDKGVVRVEIFADDVLVARDTEAPYAVFWNTAEAWNGPHVVKAVATDTIGQTGQARVDVKVAPHAPDDLAGIKRDNSSVLIEQFINVLTWRANAWNRDLVSLRVYVLEDESWTLLAELPAEAVEYRHANVPRSSSLRYRLRAVDSSSVEGDPAEVTVR